MSSYWEKGSFSQPTEAELQSRVNVSRQEAKNKGKTMQPVVIQGRSIAKSWWGRAWCDNLERYADYETRLERGKRYVRSGTVLDLRIEKGKILARVQGSRKRPYKVEIQISPLSEQVCQDIMDKCGRKPKTLEDLAAGSFPEEMKELFTGQGGLFPTPREISFHCSCPDWALMCKHVAAALYGVGARLDEDPTLFFQLRGIEMDRFIDVALVNRVEAMLENARRPSGRIIEDEDLTALFGVL